MNRPALVLLVVAAAVLGGCSLLQPAGPAPAQVAPGVTERGLANASALAAANADSLRDGFTLRRNYTDRIPEHDGYVIHHETTTRVDQTFEHFHTVTDTVARRNGTTNAYTTETWSNGTVVFTRFANDSVVRYRRHDAARFPYGPSNLTHRDAVRGVQNGTVMPTTGSRYRLAYDLGRGDGPRNETGTGHAVFDERGRVYEIAASTTFDTRIGRAHVNGTLRWSDRGATSVPRPEWIAEAIEATDP